MAPDRLKRLLFDHLNVTVGWLVYGNLRFLCSQGYNCLYLKS
jgi:hypothetical protein